MATYDYTFELNTDQFNIEGEIDFDGGDYVDIKYDSGFEITLKQQKRVQKLFEQLSASCKSCGEIQNIEISKKV